MKKMHPKDIETYVESAESAFYVLGGMVLLMVASMILLPSDVQVAVEGEKVRGEILPLLVKNGIGFIFLFFSTMLMQNEMITLVRKIPGQMFFAQQRSYLHLGIMALGLFVMMMLIKMIMLYVPYLGYAFTAAFVFGYFTLMKKLSRSKSGGAKVMFILMTMLVLLVVLAILAFVYLTREG